MKFRLTFEMPHLSDIDKARVVSYLENGRPITNYQRQNLVWEKAVFIELKINGKLREV
jgi:hypothetical protein